MSATVFEAPAVVASFDDVAVVGDAIQQRSGHLGVAKDRRPFTKRQVRRYDDRGPLVELADQMEEQLPA